jgi:hypothetical protein
MMAPDVSSGAITFGFDSCASRASSRLIVEVDIGELLAAVVAHDEARVLLFDGPRRAQEPSERPYLLVFSYSKFD